LQGNNYLYGEIDSVFSPMTESIYKKLGFKLRDEYKVENMKIKHIDLRIDIGLCGNIHNPFIDEIRSNDIIWNKALHLIELNRI